LVVASLPDWLTDASPYPGNSAAFQQLREGLRQARVSTNVPRIICFAGAGCSMPLLPGWGDLLSGMRDDLRNRVRLSAQRSAIDALPAPIDAIGGYLGFVEELKANAEPSQFFRALKERLTLPKGKPRFRRTHAAIACLDVDGIVTTNFDRCLSDAQARRFQLDPKWFDCQQGPPCEVGLNGGARDKIEAWLKDGWAFSFGGETNTPLYLHGSLLSASDVVIASSDYTKFYDLTITGAENVGVFFLENLAGVASLVFIGYSFTDPFIDTVLTRVARRPIWRGDHFALLGVKDSEIANLDTMSKKLANLRIAPIYYPITAPDHPTLQELLDAFECYDPAMVNKIVAMATPDPTPRPTGIPLLGADTGFGPATITDNSTQEWNKLPHVNAHQYVERSTELRMLDDLASNIRVRIICLLGLGGTGKTTLLRRVFEVKSLADARFPDGLVVYPVRDDAQVDALVDALCDRFPPLAPFDRDDRASRLQHAGQILKRKRMLLVLDGAELLQERPGQAEHGRFLSDDLRGLLLDVAREGQALVAITSRFAPNEFKAYLGTSYRTIDLGGFTPRESIAFLRRAGVDDDDKALTEVHHAFEGHPLGLALFAGAIMGAHTSALAGGSVLRALTFLRNATSLDERLAALLEWYRKDLSAAQLAILTLLAVYPTSVSQIELRALLRDGRVKVGDDALTIEQGENVLSALESLRLIQFDANQGRYECHAVVRQGMRRRDPDAARAAIFSLTGDAPTFTAAATMDELQRVVDAIEIAVESLGDFRQASQLLAVRLNSGGRFLDLGVPNIGVACLGRLVSDDPWRDGQTRRQAAEAAIGKHSVGVYVSWMRILHGWLGNLSEAERWRRIDGEYYLDWTSEPETEHYSFWTDGLNYARARGDASATRIVRAETWQRYGSSINRAIKELSFGDKGLADLALSFADLSQRPNDPWFQLNSDIYHQALKLPTANLVSLAFDLVARRVGIFLPKRLLTPGGKHEERFITTKPSEIRARRNRLDTANYRINLVALARTSGSPSAPNLFRLARLSNVRTDDEGEQVALARTFLAIADLFDHARAGPMASLARSWAAEQLIYVGQAASALEWSNRALDISGEDQLQRIRALYMRGKARLATGAFADAIEDANTAAALARAAEERFMMAETQELRWQAAKHAGDVRYNEWEEEMRVFCSGVYRQEDYDALPDFDLLPGEPGFHKEYPLFDWPDDYLSATPPQLKAIKAIADGTIGDLLQEYRRDILKL
jgi:hypothetical protein